VGYLSPRHPRQLSPALPSVRLRRPAQARHTGSGLGQQPTAGVTFEQLTLPTENGLIATWTAMPANRERHRADRDEGVRSGATEDSNRSLKQRWLPHGWTRA
jgi:hypothetical protein